MLGPEQRAFSCVGADRKMIRYRSKRPPETELRAKLRDLAKARWARERWSPGFVHDQFVCARRLRERTIRPGTSFGHQLDKMAENAVAPPLFSQ